jgi:hypothetical protein
MMPNCLPNRLIVRSHVPLVIRGCIDIHFSAVNADLITRYGTAWHVQAHGALLGKLYYVEARKQQRKSIQ